jgi:hypothetical protein
MVTPMRITLLVLLAVTAACASDITEPGRPKAEVRADGLEFLPGVDILPMSVTNTGGRPMEWTRARLMTSWVATEPEAGVIAPGATQEIMVRVTRTTAPLGTQVASVILDTNLFEGPITIGIVVHVPPVPAVTLVSAPPVVYPEQGGIVTIVSSGRGDLIWSARMDVDWVEVYTPGGTVPQREMRQVGYRFDRRLVQRDTVVHMIIDSNDAAGPLTIPIHINGNPPPIHLGADVQRIGSYSWYYHTVSAVGGPWLNADTGLPLDFAFPPGTTAAAPFDSWVAAAHGTGFSIIVRSTGVVQRYVEIGHPIRGIIWAPNAPNGYIYAIADGLANGRTWAFNRQTGQLTEQQHALPPFRMIGGVLGSYYRQYSLDISTAAGIHRFELHEAELRLVEGGGADVTFADDDATFWRWNPDDWNVMLTSAGRVVRLGAADYGWQLTTVDGAMLPRVRSLTGGPTVLAATADGPWRVYTASQRSTAEPLRPLDLLPIEWDGGVHPAEPRYVYRLRSQELAVVQRVTAGPFEGHWFTTFLWGY